MRLVEAWRRATARLEIVCERCGEWACLYVSRAAILTLQERALGEGRWPSEEDRHAAMVLAEWADGDDEARGEMERVRKLAEAAGLLLAVLQKESWQCPYCGHICRY